MMTKRIKIITSLLAFSLIFGLIPGYPASAVKGETVVASSVDDPLPFDLDCASAVLMDAATGTVLYNKNGSEALPPASVTKVMTLLLTMEAIDSGKISLGDVIQVSEYASSMGGSQVFLEPGEEITVEDLIKSVVISSANDAAVTLAETVSGSESAFIEAMNARADELGMNNTNFENATGLDDTVKNHVTSALDIAIMSRELLSHETILKYSSIWMDSIRNGEFGLTNTNRLIRFYKGATGLKTGSTSKAKFCISATAKRDGLHLIAVIMGAPTRDVRNEAAKQLLDYGFANYSIYEDHDLETASLKVSGGVEPYVKTERAGFSALIGKGAEGKIEKETTYEEALNAPVKKGDVVGKVTYKSDGKIIGTVDITAASDVDKISFGELLLRILSVFTMSGKYDND